MAVLSFKQQTLLPEQLFSPPRILEDGDLLNLYQGIQAALPDIDCPIVQLLSSYAGEGVTTIGCELAMLAIQMLGCRTLRIEMRKPVDDDPTLWPDRSLLDVALGSTPLINAIAKPAKSSFWQAFLTSRNERENIYPNLQKLKSALTPLREQFKLILLHTPGVLTDPAVVSYGCLADASVFVIEAESTRSPAAKRSIQLINKMGAPLIGLAFNKRRHHIPESLYRLL